MDRGAYGHSSKEHDSNLELLESGVKQVAFWRMVTISFWSIAATVVFFEVFQGTFFLLGSFSKTRLFYELLFVAAQLALVFPLQCRTEAVTRRVFPNLLTSIRYHVSATNAVFVGACMAAATVGAWAFMMLAGWEHSLKSLTAPCMIDQPDDAVCVSHRNAYTVWTGCVVGATYAVHYIYHGRAELKFPLLQLRPWPRFTAALPDIVKLSAILSVACTRALGLLFWVGGTTAASWLVYPAQVLYGEELLVRFPIYHMVDWPLAADLTRACVCVVAAWESMRAIREIVKTEHIKFHGGSENLPYLLIALGTEQQHHTGFTAGAEYLSPGPSAPVVRLGPFGGEGGRLGPAPTPSLFWQPVTAVSLRAGTFVDSVQLAHGKVVAPRLGGTDGHLHDVHLSPGEAITRIDGSYGNLVHHIQFSTNHGRSFGPFGSRGPTTFSVTAPPGKVLCGVEGSTRAAPESLEGKGCNAVEQITFIFGPSGGGIRYADNPLLPSIPSSRQPASLVRKWAFLDLATCAHFDAETRAFLFNDRSGRLWKCATDPCLQVLDVVTQALHFSTAGEAARRAAKVAARPGPGLFAEVRRVVVDRIKSLLPAAALPPTSAATAGGGVQAVPGATVYGAETDYERWKDAKDKAQAVRTLREIFVQHLKATRRLPLVNRLLFLSPASLTRALFSDIEVQTWAVQALSLLLKAAVTEDKHGVALQSVPRILNSLLSCLIETEEYITSLRVNSEHGRIAGYDDAEPKALADRLRCGIYLITTTYYEQLTAFAFPPKCAARLQEFATFSA